MINQVFVDKLSAELEKLGITLSKKQEKQFFQYYELLMEWNKVMNLTAITEMDDVVSKHFVDSLSLVKAVDGLDQSSATFIDVGTGAGFPGIPLKIAFPGLQITLLDSLKKRVHFLYKVISELELYDVMAVHGRAEDFGKDAAYREKFDYCVSRAVANIATLSEYCLPFVKVAGTFVSYKSGKTQEELKAGEQAIRLLGGDISDIVHFSLQDINMERTLVVIRKMQKTEGKYPRKAGIPARKPLSN